MPRLISVSIQGEGATANYPTAITTALNSLFVLDNSPGPTVYTSFMRYSPLDGSQPRSYVIGSPPSGVAATINTANTTNSIITINVIPVDSNGIDLSAKAVEVASITKIQADSDTAYALLFTKDPTNTYEIKTRVHNTMASLVSAANS